MMTTVAGHSSKDVIMTMVAKMMRRMTQISKMCLGSIASMGISLTVSIFLHSKDVKSDAKDSMAPYLAFKIPN